IRLGRLRCELLPRQPESMGLLALMLLQHSRRDARVVKGELVTLEEQNRAKWDRESIAEGLLIVEQALLLGTAGPYQLQAAIAALHAQAPTTEQTDWPLIAALYQKRLDVNPVRVVALNHAVAIAMSGGIEEGLRRIDEMGLTASLDHYYLFHAARADLLRRLQRRADAAAAYRRAAALTTNPVEAEFLRRRLRELSEG